MLARRQTFEKNKHTEHFIYTIIYLNAYLQTGKNLQVSYKYNTGHITKNCSHSCKHANKTQNDTQNIVKT